MIHSVSYNNALCESHDTLWSIVWLWPFWSPFLKGKMRVGSFFSWIYLNVIDSTTVFKRSSMCVITNTLCVIDDTLCVIDDTLCIIDDTLCVIDHTLCVIDGTLCDHNFGSPLQSQWIWFCSQWITVRLRGCWRAACSSTFGHHRVRGASVAQTLPDLFIV